LRGGGQLLRHGSLRYELLEALGSGGMGDVHVARVVGGLERRVCIKRLAGTLSPEQAGALREEARVLASVRHANVVSLLGFAEDEEAGPFLVLELVEGLDLRALSRRLDPDRLADGVAVHVACALLRALSAVQRCLPGLVHRDVTPHNVLVSSHGEVKLGDFGIALARDRTRWTRPLHVKGKPGYMSPEQIRGEELDPRSDLFAVGIVLYELLAGERPWGPAAPGGGVREMMRTLEEPAVPLASHRPRLAPGLVSAVERLTARSPDSRFASPEDALRALAPFGAGELGSLRLASLIALVSPRDPRDGA
jgi:serine/threonine-protein kinase